MQSSCTLTAHSRRHTSTLEPSQWDKICYYSCAIIGCGNVDLTSASNVRSYSPDVNPLLALLLLFLATRDAHARQGGGDKDGRKHDIAILKGDDEGFLGQILAQHRLDLGVHEFPHVSSLLQYPR